MVGMIDDNYGASAERQALSYVPFRFCFSQVAVFLWEDVIFFYRNRAEGMKDHEL